MKHNMKTAKLPPGMRRRTHKSGNTFYYLDKGGKPRREIALGDDYVLALRKYSDLMSAPTPITTFGAVMDRYMREAKAETIKLGTNTLRTATSDIKHLYASFKDAPMDQLRPLHIKKFLDKHSAIKTTANRCKRLFSTIWNHARGWGYTDLSNPCEGIKGHKLPKNKIYISDAVFLAVRAHAAEPLQDAMDIAYLTGQRPGDVVGMKMLHIADELLAVKQGKTGKPLQVEIIGELAEAVARVTSRFGVARLPTSALLLGRDGHAVTRPALRYQFDQARLKAAKAHPELAEEIGKMVFRGLRSKAADDVAADRGEQAASDLLGHDSVRTTQQNYLLRGKKVKPTK